MGSHQRFSVLVAKYGATTRACIQLGGFAQGTEQNQTRNTVLMIRSLVLFWGFPNHLSSESWAVGLEEADHAALWMARRPMGADQRSSARPRRSCGRQCSRQPAV